jgi:HSP20 family protein
MKTTTQRETRVNADHEVEYLAPEVNIFESKDGYVLEAEMPGVNKEGLEITLEDNQMTILGRRHMESMPGEAVFRESRDAQYKRVFALDPAIDTAKITARMDQGVLTLTLPKSERVKPRKITVT